MKRSLSSLLVTALGLALLVYSATRSVDFITATLPADKQLLAWFGLASLDGGLLFWMLYFMAGAEGSQQRAIALVMTVVDFIGATAMFTLDTLYRTGESGLTVALSASEIRAAVLGLSLVIALNIAATVANHLLDPDVLRAMAQYEAQDEIESESIRLIRESAPQLAAELAPQLASDWAQRTRAAYSGLDTSALSSKPKPRPDAPRKHRLWQRPPATLTLTPSNHNGHMDPTQPPEL